MFGFSVKDTLKLVLAVTLLGLTLWGTYSIVSSQRLLGATKIIQQQGEVNEEENRRSMEALSTGRTINTESDTAFTKRLCKYYTSQGINCPNNSEGLQDTEPKASSDNKLGQYAVTEAETGRVLQDIGLLPAEATELLCNGLMINVLSPDGLTIVSRECVQW